MRRQFGVFAWTEKETHRLVQVIACAHGTICVCAMRMSVCVLKKMLIPLLFCGHLNFYRAHFTEPWIRPKITIVRQKRCCDGVFRIFMQCACFVAYLDVFPKMRFNLMEVIKSMWTMTIAPPSDRKNGPWPSIDWMIFVCSILNRYPFEMPWASFVSRNAWSA